MSLSIQHPQDTSHRSLCSGRWLILSDSHRDIARLQQIVQAVACDGVVHLGDGTQDLQRIPCLPVRRFWVCGNAIPQEPGRSRLVLQANGIKLFAAHGHHYGVKNSLQPLAAAAGSQGCALALYGHTHRPGITQTDGVFLVCPGAVCAGQYAVLDVSPNAGLHLCLASLTAGQGQCLHL